MSIANFVIEFESLYNKAKAYDMVLLDGILAYKFLNNAAISDSQAKLIRATLTTLTYESMKEQMRKIFGDLTLPISSNSTLSASQRNSFIKVEPTDEFALEGSHLTMKEILLDLRGIRMILQVDHLLIKVGIIEIKDRHSEEEIEEKVNQKKCQGDLIIIIMRLC